MNNDSNDLVYGDQFSDISIREVIETLIDGKWIIAACLALSFFAAGLFLVFTPVRHQGSLDLLPISLFEADKYEKLNSVTEAGGKDAPVALFEISPDLLLELLGDDLTQRETFEEAIRELGALKESHYKSKENYAEAVSREAASIRLTPPASAKELANAGNRKLNTNWRIEYTHHNKDMVRDVIAGAVERSEARVHENLNNRFEEFVALRETRDRELIEDANLAIELKIDEFNRAIENRKAVLKEQAAVARVLGIAKNTLESRPVNASGSIVAIPQTSNEPLFMRGYEALEKELAQIGERENNLNFVPGLVELQTEILSIQQNPILERLKAAYAETPLAQDNFKAANFQRAWVSVSTPASRYLIPLAILLIGGTLGILVVSIRRIMR